jgi:hypothetical protein
MYKGNLPGITGVEVETKKENRRYEENRVRRLVTTGLWQRRQKCLLVFFNLTTMVLS